MTFKSFAITATVGAFLLTGLPQANAMVIVQHRGAHVSHTEDTVASQVAAIANRADCAETDLRYTKDGRVVQMHDARVDRTTDGTGRVAELTYDYIRSLHGFVNGEQVPNFRESLKAMRRVQGCLQVELKLPKTQWTSDRLLGLAANMSATNMTRHVVVTSSNPDLLLRLNDVVPQVRVFWKCLVNPTAARVKELGVDGVILRRKFVSRIKVRQLHRAAEVVVHATVADTRARWSEYAKAGVDGSMTNRSLAFARWQARH